MRSFGLTLSFVFFLSIETFSSCTTIITLLFGRSFIHIPYFFIGKECVVEFDFLGKDSIRYHNDISVEKRVFKNLQLFVDGKKPGDDLFDRLNTSILNEYLNTLMPGLTAKVTAFLKFCAPLVMRSLNNALA